MHQFITNGHRDCYKMRQEKYDKNFTPTISFAHLGQTKTCKSACLFDSGDWMNQNSVEVLLMDNVLINGHYLKNTKQHFSWKLLYVRIWFWYDCHPLLNSSSKIFILNSRTLSIFPALEIKKLALVGKILWCFDIIFHILLINSLFH